jgi:hypothetical protein
LDRGRELADFVEKESSCGGLKEVSVAIRCGVRERAATLEAAQARGFRRIARLASKIE